MSLPKGYKRLEYIQSSRTQYIDTLFNPTQNTRLVLDVAFLGSAGANVAGVRNSSGDETNRFGIISFGSASKLGAFFRDSSIQAITFDNNRHLYDLSKNGLVVDGTAYGGANSGTFACTYPFVLFGWNEGSGGVTKTASVVYGCRLYENELLVRDFIPCQNASGAIGLWDAVNEVFYGNSGTGTFTAGPVVPEQVDESEITELEYIQSSGTQYINTDFMPNNYTRLTGDFEITEDDDTWKCIFGAREDSLAKCFSLFTRSSNPFYCNIGTKTDIYTFSTLSVLGSHAVDANKNVVAIDGISVTLTAQTFQNTTTTIYLCANNEDGVASMFCKLKWRSCQIYDNGLLERDFVPSMLANGEVGLYDRVFHEFYRNAGTGEFIAGPEMVHEGYTELEYVESNGAQYFDTKFKPNSNTKIKVDFEVTALPANYSAVFSARNSTGGAGAFSLWVNKNGPVFLWQFNTGAGKSTPVGSPNVVGNRVTAENVANVMNVSGVSLTEAAATFSGNYSLYLFASNDPGTDRLICSAKLYFCQIYDNGTAVRIYIPKIHPSGVAGLWDSVNERFYASATTTDFTAGPEAQTVPKAPSNFRVEAPTDTLVTLAWDPMEEVQGYRLYRQGQLLADTTETSVSVTVEPFAGAVFTLTAYNENGEGTETSLTHYSIPENPLLYLITDRTAQDVAERNPKGYYAASDLNRVGYAMDYLANIIRGYGYKLEVDTKTDWTDEGWKLSGEMVKYLQSLNNLKGVFSALIELPETMEKIDYQDANNIEQLLLTVDETIVRVVAGFTRANAFALRSGSKGLPVSYSDRGRNWGQLDALKTTWANWQLATWYLLLYGNLKAEGVVE